MRGLDNTQTSWAAGDGQNQTDNLETVEMAYTLRTRRSTFGSLVLAAVLGLALTSTALAQEPGGRFRVLIPNPEVEGGIKENFAKSVANETRKLIDGMVTHRSLERGDLNNLLKQYNLKEKDLDCILSQQLAAQAGIELVLCATLSPGTEGVAVEASFVTKEQARFEVPPTEATDAKAIAQHIFVSFETFVNQLRLVQFCNEDLASSQWQPALDKCSEALKLNPTSQEAMYGIGYAQMQLERYEEALASLKKLLEVNPIHSEALQAAGFIAAKLGDTAASRDYYKQYLELDPGNIQIRLTIALDAHRAGDPGGALEIVEQGLSPESEDLQLMEYAGYFAAAVAAQLADQKNTNGDAGEDKADAAQYYQKAIEYFSAVYEKRGVEETTSELFVQLINALTQVERFDEAVEIGKVAVAAKPGEVSLWRAYAMALRQAGNLDEAIVAMDSVLANDPEAQNIRAQQAQWLLQADRLDDAASAFKRAVDAGEIESEAAGMIIFARGINDFYNKGLYEQAEPFFVAAKPFVTKAQSKGQINFFHGLLYYLRGMKASEPETLASARVSLPIFQKALELFNQSGTYGEMSERNATILREHINNTKTYIEIQEALIKRGR